MKINKYSYGCFISSLIFFITAFSLPERLFPFKWRYDSMKIRGDIYDFDLDGSFESTSNLMYFWGDVSAGSIVFLTSVIWIFLASFTVRSLSGAFFYFITFLPMCLLNLIWPAKETIVILLSLVSYSLLKRNSIALNLLVGLLYCLYAYYVRSYYFLIFFIFFAIYLMSYFNGAKVRFFDLSCLRINWATYVYLAFLFFVISFFLPSDFYISSQGQRDVSNNYALLEGSFNITAFYNLLEVQSGFNFIINYLWAILHIFLPFVLGFGLNQVLLFLFNSGIVIITHFSFKNRIVEPCFLMFSSHIFVLLLFEPDQGSYFRHALSASVYLFPLANNIFFKPGINKGA